MKCMRETKGFGAILVILIIALVIVAGVAVWYFMAYQSSLVGSHGQVPSTYATSSVQVAAATTGAVGLKTYTNTAYDFSFQYPSNLLIDPIGSSSSIILSSNATSVLDSEYDLAVSMDTNPNNLSMKQYFTDDVNDNGADLYTRSTVSTTTVDSLPATVFAGSTLYDMTTSEVIVVPYQGGFLEIVNNNLDDATFNAIVKSFKLATNSSGWQTYTNQQYGFQFQYPDSDTIALNGSVIVISSPNTEYLLNESGGELNDEIYITPNESSTQLSDDLGLPAPIVPSVAYFTSTPVKQNLVTYLGSVTTSDGRIGYQVESIGEFSYKDTLFQNSDGTWLDIGTTLIQKAGEANAPTSSEPYDSIVATLKFN
jgi:hypothetical protein